MDNDNGSLLEQKSSDKHNFINREQGSEINAQSLHINSWNPIMNAGFNLLQENATRLASVRRNGNRFPLPQASMNVRLNSAGIALPQTSDVPAANLNSVGIGLINLHNAGVVALSSMSQAVMMTAAPPLTTANSYELLGSIASQPANDSSGLFTSREEMSRTSSKNICKDRTNLNKQTKITPSQNYSEPSTSPQIEELDPHKNFSQLPGNVASYRAVIRGEKTRKSGTNFPSKLYEILSRNDIADIISWSPHGRSWKVHKPKVFEERIIPQYFKHSKYNSFTRQVNGWGFHRITQGLDHNAYYHELFLRGLPHLCKHMRRQNSAVNGENDTCNRTDPDFYRISELSPLPKIDGDAATQESTRTSPQQASQQNCAFKEAEENRKPSATPHIVDATVAPSLTLENVLGLSQESFTQIGPNPQQQLFQTQLIRPMATWPMLIDPNNVQQRLLVQQAIHNDQIGRLMRNVSFRNMNPVSISSIDPVIIAQAAANIPRSYANASRSGSFLGSYNPFM